MQTAKTSYALLNSCLNTFISKFPVGRGIFENFFRVILATSTVSADGVWFVPEPFPYYCLHSPFNSLNQHQRPSKLNKVYFFHYRRSTRAVPWEANVHVHKSKLMAKGLRPAGKCVCLKEDPGKFSSVEVVELAFATHTLLPEVRKWNERILLPSPPPRLEGTLSEKLLPPSTSFLCHSATRESVLPLVSEDLLVRGPNLLGPIASLLTSFVMSLYFLFFLTYATYY